MLFRTKERVEEKMPWEINFEILKAAKKIGHCPCHLTNPCPCDDFLNDKQCKCGAYKMAGEVNG